MNLNFISSNKRFSSFFWTQVMGAFNDNLFKNTLIVLVTFRGVQLAGLGVESVVALASGLFMLPFFLFSPLAGQLADRYEKSKIIRITKIAEIVIMLVAALGFFFQSYMLLMGILFLMGMQSTFFGPVKYSIIPNLVESEDLVQGNAFVELGTFLAILGGTILGGLLSSMAGADWLVGLCLVLFAVVGYLISLGVPASKIGNESLKIQWNPISEYINLFKICRQQTAVFNSILAISWFWFFGAGILSVLPVYVKNYLGADEQVVTLFLALFTFGIGFGSILCEKFSFKVVEIGLVPIGSIGMTIFLVDLYFCLPTWAVILAEPIGIKEFLSHAHGWRLMMDFFMMSMFGGIFIVPLYALLQERSPEELRSRVIAGNNILNAAFMVLSSVLVLIFYLYQLNTAEIFGIFALLNMIVAIYIYSVVPEFVLRFYSWILSHLMYRVTVVGTENIPKTGACILACNHVTFVDWLILSGVCKRPARFVMYYKYFDIPLIRILLRQAKVIPIAGGREDKSILEKAYAKIDEELKEGEVVFIFPEGQLTKDGKLSLFRPGVSKMVAQNQCPVVPVVVHGLWGSIFSRKKDKDRPYRRQIKVEVLPIISAKDFSIQGLEEKIANSLGEEPPYKRKKELL